MRKLYTYYLLPILGLFLFFTSSLFAQTKVVANYDYFTINFRDQNKDFAVWKNDTPNTAQAFTEYSVIKTPKQSTSFLMDDYLGTFTYTPKVSFVGRDSFIYELCVDGECDTALVLINVTAALRPLAVNDTIEADFQDTYGVDVALNDKNLYYDGSQLNYDVTIVSQPKYGKASVDGWGDVVYESVVDFSGMDTFRYRICDEFGLCSEAKIIVKLGLRPYCDVEFYKSKTI